MKEAMQAAGLVFGGTHYGNGDHEFVEVLGGPATVATVADAVQGRLHRLAPWRAASVELDNELVGLTCGTAECTAELVGREWFATVPEGTRLTVQAWPCPDDECACAQARAWRAVSVEVAGGAA